MVKKCIAWAATKIKGCSITFDPAITSGYLFQVGFAHASALIRGIIRFRCVVSVGSHVTLRGKSHFKLSQGIVIGDFCHIGGAGGVHIGDDTIIGAYFSVHPENHLFDDKSQLIRLQGVSHQGIVIGKNCWIGAKVTVVTVLDGATIGDGCVVAAGSVVKGVFPDGCAIGGIPARILKRI
ncbi:MULTISPECIES: acyltransferase [Symbiopectobacterium]|uniref:acyltransferase n=1 Tax=Symbiopectobacterium TaxID=801 RepID=UPI001A2452D1|nr:MULTISPECIES: acyltransferase [Symbiopectobacterium]MBG6247619.1 acyltransferase [Candidatus Symbiopectobacterium sp. PLON1]MBT9429740.1 acyltransferase [Candidatus Symbiopectobacterium endolongispinus]